MRISSAGSCLMMQFPIGWPRKPITDIVPLLFVVCTLVSAGQFG